MHEPEAMMKSDESELHRTEENRKRHLSRTEELDRC